MLDPHPGQNLDPSKTKPKHCGQETLASRVWQWEHSLVALGVGAPQFGQFSSSVCITVFIGLF
jgi:hypothetical protein